MKFKALACAALLAASAGTALADDLNLNVALVPNAALPGAYSGILGVTHLEAGAFTDTFNFAGGIGGRLSGALVSIGFLDTTDIDFTSVMVNGQAFSLERDGALDLASIGLTTVNDPIVLTVMGVAGPMLAANSPVAASYGGSINISPVPEPETYAMMLAGLAMLGFTARRRRQP